MKELILKKCMKCGALVQVFEDCHCENCGIQCCKEAMKTLVPNSADAAAEKHLPTYEINDGKIFVTVNHVMEEDHYIEWIAFATNNKMVFKYLKPGKEATAHCKYKEGMAVYSYCNKHGLWKIDVK